MGKNRVADWDAGMSASCKSRF